jgi:hypothetical protein
MSRFTLGIGHSDDIWYMEDAVLFQWRHILINHYWSPLYDAWLHIIALVTPDGLWEFFASWALLLLLLMVLPALFRLRYSWIYATVLLCGPFFTVKPFIWIFSAVLITLGACLVLYKQRTIAEAMFAACVTSFILSFARSEFDTIVWVTGATCLAALLIEARRSVMDAAGSKSSHGWNRWLMVATILLLFGVASYTKKVARGERSGMAFAQHFNIRAAERGALQGPNAWSSNYAEQAFGVDTGHNALTSTASLGDYFRANPRLFLRHVFTNLRDPKTLIFVLFIAIVLGIPWLRKDRRGLRPAGLFVASMVVPALIEISLIYPRDHYALMVFPALLLLLLQSVPEQSVSEPPLVILLGAGAILMISVSVIVPRITGDTTPRMERVRLRQIRCMRTADRASASSSIVFEPQPVEDILLLRKHVAMDGSALPLWSDFKSWSSANHPSWIAVDEQLPAHYGVQPAEMQDFLHGQLGYVAHACPAKAGMTVYTPGIR